MSDSAHINTSLRQLFVPGASTQAQSLTKSTPLLPDSPDVLQQLDVLDQAIAQVVPQVTLEATDTLNPNQPLTSLKEAEKQSAEISPIEAASGLQAVEVEPQPEVPAEVEQYLTQVEQHPEQTPDEIVIADGTTPALGANQPVKKPVVVLPITPQEEKEGKKRPISDSFRWLVEWSQKIIKMFTGEVVYRPESHH